MYVITLSCEIYYIIMQEECITLSGKIITLSGSTFITLSGDVITLSGSYYIIRQLLTGDYYIIDCNSGLFGFFVESQVVVHKTARTRCKACVGGGIGTQDCVTIDR